LPFELNRLDDSRWVAHRERRTAICELIFDAGSGYYQSLGLSRPETIEHIEAEVLRAPGELASIFTLEDENGVSGLVASVLENDLDAGQKMSLARALKKMPSDKRQAASARMREHNTRIAPHFGGGRYLSRIAVLPAYRGQGIGSLLMQRVLAALEDEAVSLHVDRENEVAVALYRKFGFEPQGDADYRMMFYRRPGRR
jgi:ribosomal protein S18 acetylase RimI-like enzyme